MQVPGTVEIFFVIVGFGKRGERRGNGVKQREQRLIIRDQRWPLHPREGLGFKFRGMFEWTNLRTISLSLSTVQYYNYEVF